MPTVTFKTTMELGSMVRSQVVGVLKEAAFKLNLKLELDEIERNWVESRYTLKVVGESKHVDQFQKYYRGLSVD